MRQLATIRVINKLRAIEGADAILLAEIDGWQCIVKKDEFNEGDPCVYFEIDSLIPMRAELEHLRFRAFKRMGDKEGIRIKTIKLRGQLSQGIALPLSMFPEITDHTTDLDELLGVLKFELPIPTELAGQVRGNFPSDIPKTEQPRCQNIGYKILVENAESRYEVSMKMNGTSFTAYTRAGLAGVCGRNWDLDMADPDNQGNSLIRMFIDSKLRDAMLSLDRDFAVQGELMGPGIQQNYERFESHKLFVFDIFNITTGKHLPPAERHAIMEELWDRGVDRNMVQHAPILELGVTLADLCITDLPSLLLHAEGPSVIHNVREGEVFKRMDGEFSFKVISNKFLLKEVD